jgi:hypothetical protein
MKREEVFQLRIEKKMNEQTLTEKKGYPMRRFGKCMIGDTKKFIFILRKSAWLETEEQPELV